MKQLTKDQEMELDLILKDIHTTLGGNWSAAIMLRNDTTVRFIVDDSTPVTEVIVAAFGQPGELRAAEVKP